MLRVFDNRVALDVDEIIAVDREEREYRGYRQYIVYFRGGSTHEILCEPYRITLEEMYPEFTEWFVNLGKEECATI